MVEAEGDGACREGDAERLIRELGLVPHPEGGFYREVFRSGRSVGCDLGRRAAMTVIDFLLRAGERSRWHRLRADECWFFSGGAELALWVAAADGSAPCRHLLGPVSDRCAARLVVPAGCWQAARSLGAFSLVGCGVGPGFDFADFELLSPEHQVAERLRVADPAVADLF